MRPIKFRAWDVKGLKMIYDDVLEPSGSWGDGGLSLSLRMTGEIDVWTDDDGGKNGLHEHHEGVAKKDRLTLMQFTGLFDKNGKEIFEGDICKVVAFHPVLMETYTEFGVMEWIEKEARFGVNVKDSLLDENMDNLKVEVLGNIHENLELLK